MNWRSLVTRDDFETHSAEIERFGIGAIGGPDRIAEWTLDECAAYGELAAGYGLAIAETFRMCNPLHPDPDYRTRAISDLRELLRRADVMRVGSVVTLAGSLADGDTFDGAIRPHPDNWSSRAVAGLREFCERVLDGLDLTQTTYSLEPMPSSFFHEPEPIAEFLTAVGHPLLKLHLDMMNMHSMHTYFHSTELIDRTFDLLADHIVVVHAKDLLWSDREIFVRLLEVVPGDGVLDYPRFVERLRELPADIPVMTEHWADIEDYHRGIDYLRTLATEKGVPLVRANRAR
jgi:sugar phosphate isomerase/epimerase